MVGRSAISFNWGDGCYDLSRGVTGLERAAQPQCICTNTSSNFSGSTDLCTLMLLPLVACDNEKFPCSHSHSDSCYTLSLLFLLLVKEEDRRAFEKARDAAVAEAGEWCEGEIEAVRHMLSKQLESSQQEVQRW